MKTVIPTLSTTIRCSGVQSDSIFIGRNGGFVDEIISVFQRNYSRQAKFVRDGVTSPHRPAPVASFKSQVRPGASRLSRAGRDVGGFASFRFYARRKKSQITQMNTDYPPKRQPRSKGRARISSSEEDTEAHLIPRPNLQQTFRFKSRILPPLWYESRSSQSGWSGTGTVCERFNSQNAWEWADRPLFLPPVPPAAHWGWR